MGCVVVVVAFENADGKRNTRMTTVTVNLPETVYRRLTGMAIATARSLDELSTRLFAGNLPPVVDDLPRDMQDELSILVSMSDSDLWALTRSSLPPDRWHRHEQLLEKNELGEFSAAEHEELRHLRDAVDRFVLRRSCALALLKWRGHALADSWIQAQRSVSSAQFRKLDVKNGRTGTQFRCRYAET